MYIEKKTIRQRIQANLWGGELGLKKHISKQM